MERIYLIRLIRKIRSRKIQFVLIRVIRGFLNPCNLCNLCFYLIRSRRQLAEHFSQYRHRAQFREVRNVQSVVVVQGFQQPRPLFA